MQRYYTPTLPFRSKNIYQITISYLRYRINNAPNPKDLVIVPAIDRTIADLISLSQNKIELSSIFELG